MRVKVLDIEAGGPLEEITGLSGYDRAWVLVRLHGVPIGRIAVAPRGDRIPADLLRTEIASVLGDEIVRHLIADALAVDPGALRDARELARVKHPAAPPPEQLVTVAVCTRDRSEQLASCLEALCTLGYPNVELLVVDNAPSDGATEMLVRERFPSVRYVCEPRPGLDWARNRALAEANGTIIAYTDDDAIVDRAWVSAIARVFEEEPDVDCVTGLVVPYEIETAAQELFERYGGFGRGYTRRWYRLPRRQRRRTPRWAKGAGQFGTGANMAFRRRSLERLGGFDPALDVGTVTGGGGDLHVFYRVLKEGGTLVYEPAAIVHHRHRHRYDDLRVQLANNGHGLYSYFVASARAYPEERLSFLSFALWWLWYWDVRRLLRSFVTPAAFPRDLIWAELMGALRSPSLYGRAMRAARQLGRIPPPHGSRQTPSLAGSTSLLDAAPPPVMSSSSSDATAVRVVDVAGPLAGIRDVAPYRWIRIYAAERGRPIGECTIETNGRAVAHTRLCEELSARLGASLGGGAIEHACAAMEVDAGATGADASARAEQLGGARAIHVVVANLLKIVTPGGADARSAPIAEEQPVSVVIGTRDRPDDLRSCLQALRAQKTRRTLEIVVVDNNPASGLTPRVVGEFEGVKLVREQRPGVSYARNAGILACSHEIIATTDDDVRVAPEWIESLIAPFARPDVAAVTGLVLPLELETRAQHLFEQYGGLGRGYTRREVDGSFFHRRGKRALNTWQFGGTANSAFRSAIFADPEIGMMNESLGPGTPTGVGEDTYLFYRILRAGHTLVYEPAALAWHRHRREMRAFRKQLFAYSRGHVAYHLVTLFECGDRRALWRLAVELPLTHMRSAGSSIRHRTLDRLLNVAIEIAGNLLGPFALLLSRRPGRRLGRSAPLRSVSGTQGASAAAGESCGDDAVELERAAFLG